MKKLNMPLLRKNRISYAEWCLYTQTLDYKRMKQPRYIKNHSGKDIQII